MTEKIGLFTHLAGFIVGLGATTVIDWHGFLATRSSYFTLATIRAHKITKPLIWLGVFLAIIGGIIFYRQRGVWEFTNIQIFIALVLVLNGMFLSFWVSPNLIKREREGKDSEILPKRMQTAIATSMLLSFFGWWTEVILLILYLLK